MASAGSCDNQGHNTRFPSFGVQETIFQSYYSAIISYPVYVVLPKETVTFVSVLFFLHTVAIITF